LPERVAEHDARRAALDVVGRRQQTAGGGTNAEHGKEVAADPQCLPRALLAALREIERHRSPGDDVAEDVLLFLDLQVERIRQLRPSARERPGSPVRRLDDADLGELFGPIDRQRAQADGVHQLEDRGVGAGAEREREDGDGSKRRIAAEKAGAVPQVLPECLDEAE
jgi:hypothetical protein